METENKINKIERLRNLMYDLSSTTYYLQSSSSLRSNLIPIFDQTNPVSIHTTIETVDVNQLRKIIEDQNRAICNIYRVLGEILEDTLNKYPNN